MTFLKSLWRKLFEVQMPVYSDEEIKRRIRRECIGLGARIPDYAREAYDPSTDEHKIMSGEVESYFE